MKIFEAVFIAGSDKLETLPKTNYPEIAFAGRSNVGKSSLLNSIVSRKNLAHISGKPGKTQQINFYMVDTKWIFTDMPGFGYAVVGKEKRAGWEKLNYGYLKGSKNLRLVIALTDGRHDPSEIDLGFWEWLENNNLKFIIVMTKCDKISKSLAEERKAQILEVVKNCRNCLEALPYSAFTGLGKDSLLAIIKKNAEL